MSRQVSPSTDKVYGLQRVTRFWGVSRATVYHHRHPIQAVERKRPGPLGAMSDDDLVAAIRQLLTGSPFHGEGHRKLWARLRFEGLRTSRRRVLRLMRAHGLLAPQRAGRPRGPKAHNGTITTDQVDVMWGTDLTSVMTGEGQAALQRAYASCAHGHAAVVAVDHCSAECVGLHPAIAPIASRRSSRSSRRCASALARSPRGSPPASSCATTTEADMSVTIFKPRSASSVLEAHRPSGGSLKALSALPTMEWTAPATASPCRM